MSTIDRHYREAIRQAKKLHAVFDTCVAECQPPSMRMAMCSEDVQTIIRHLEYDMVVMQHPPKRGEISCVLCGLPMFASVANVCLTCSKRLREVSA